MKFIKKITAVLLVVLLIASCVCVAGVSASATSGDKVYLKNTAGWSNPCCYMWTGAGNPQNGAWPGLPMMNVYDDVWSYTLDAAYENIIFNGSGGSVQTDDMPFPGGDKIYDNSTGQWSDINSIVLTEPETDSVTDPQTNPGGDVTTGLKVTTALNGATINTIDCTGTSVTVTYNLQAPLLLEDGQGTLKYDASKLQIQSFTLPNIKSGLISNKNVVGEAYFNFVGVNDKTDSGIFDFKTNKAFVIATFSVVGSGATTINLDIEELDVREEGQYFAYYTSKVATPEAYSITQSLANPTIDVQGGETLTQNTTAVSEPTTREQDTSVLLTEPNTDSTSDLFTSFNTNTNQAKSVFKHIPSNAEELKQVHRADALLPNEVDAAITAEDGAKGRFEVVALYFAALKAFDPKNPDTTYAMMEELCESPTTKILSLDSFNNFSRNSMKDNLSKAYKYKYVGNAYFDGAEPSNGYTPTEPLTVTLEDYVYASQPSNQYQTQVYKVVTRFNGADSERIIQVYQDSIDGKWYIFSDSWMGFTADMKEPNLKYLAQWANDEQQATSESTISTSSIQPTTIEPTTAVPTESITDSSESNSRDLVYFDATGWKNVTMIYCHIWKRGGDAFIGWQLKKEACKKVSGNTWSYDLANLEASTTMSGGLKSGEDYCIIFSAQTGKQTYDATFSKACIGDTLKLTGKQIENPVDYEKKSDEAVWTKNSGSYGPHLAFTSIGNIVGSKLCPNEKGIEVIGDWLPIYYKSSGIKDKVAVLASAYPRLGITSENQIQDIYTYIISKKTGEDEKAMKKMLEDAFAKAYSIATPDEPDDSDETYTLYYLPNAQQAMAGYNYKIALQDKNGKITIYNMEATGELVDGIRLYSAEIPVDEDISAIHYQIFDNETWLSQVSASPLDALENIITSDGKVYHEDFEQTTASGYVEPTTQDLTTVPNETATDIVQPTTEYVEPTTQYDEPTEPTTDTSVKPTPNATKKGNSIKISVKTKTVKLKKLKKKAQKVKAITVKKAKGKVTYKLVKKGSTASLFKYVKINSKGVITFNKWKKAKKGTYKIKVTITAAGNADYKKKSVSKTLKIKVK